MSGDTHLTKMEWFTDKVLPGLVGGAVVSVVVWVFAFSGSVLSVFAKSVGQSWLPDGAMIFVQSDCPTGWSTVGYADIIATHDADAIFKQYLTTDETPEHFQKKLSWANAKVCGYNMVERSR